MKKFSLFPFCQCTAQPLYGALHLQKPSGGSVHTHWTPRHLPLDASYFKKGICKLHLELQMWDVV